ncbi:VOC family protein [Dyella sp. EPa41]|uniref:VOC family protein n=1 Tax=Dyella sp. EPa41 TaxID=1561194 RepID=UPI00191536EA|nr:VOC family protein [Dyella sp. EPa41]
MIECLDHLVLTTADENACIHFYVDVLGMRLEHFGPGNKRKAFHFGHQKINLHVKGREFEPHAHLPVPGSLSLCFIVNVTLDEIIARLNALDVLIEAGPVSRRGAVSDIRSVYVRDPDLNLIELAVVVR